MHPVLTTPRGGAPPRYPEPWEAVSLGIHQGHTGSADGVSTRTPAGLGTEAPWEEALGGAKPVPSPEVEVGPELVVGSSGPGGQWLSCFGRVWGPADLGQTPLCAEDAVVLEAACPPLEQSCQPRLSLLQEVLRDSHGCVLKKGNSVSIFLPSLPSLPQIMSSKESSGMPTVSSGAREEPAKDKSTPTGTRAECWEGLGSRTTAGLCRHRSESELSRERRVRPSRSRPVLMDGRLGGHQCSSPVPVLCKGTGLETLSDLPEPPETHGKPGGSLRALRSL